MIETRHGAWLAQASDDLEWGRHTLKGGHFAQACFIAQQVAEKALKALGYSRGVELIKSHSVVQIAKALSVNGRLLEIGKRLDLYYISTRYPDALPAGSVPFEQFSESQASEALALAEEVLVHVRSELNPAA